LGIHPCIESKSLARFCCEILNLQFLAKSALFNLGRPNEAQTRHIPEEDQIQARKSAIVANGHKVVIHMKQKRTQFHPGTSGNQATQWRPGQSGNPAGKSKHRLQFEEAFVEALVTEVSAEEAARLLWHAARAGEPWAIQELCRRFAPQTPSLRMIHEVENDRLD